MLDAVHRPWSTTREQVWFEQVFAAQYPRLFRYVHRQLADAASSEDVCADVFVVLWRRREIVPVGDDDLVAWLFVVARNLVLNRQRSHRREQRLVARFRDELLSSKQPASPSSAQGLTRQQATDAFARLGAADREILALVAWDGLGPEQVAAVLGCSPGAFRVRLHRARRRLEKGMADASS